MARYKDSFDEVVGFSLSMDRMLSSILLHEQAQLPAMWRPPTDVYETHENVVILLEIAGMDPNKIQVEFSDRVLRISARRMDRQLRAACHCLEVQYGDFASEVYLPGDYAVDAIKANYQDGFLTITLPKLKPQAKVIAVHSNTNK